MSKIIQKDELKELQAKHDKEFKAVQGNLYKLINKTSKGETVNKDEIMSLKTLLETLKISQDKELNDLRLRQSQIKDKKTPEIKEKNLGGRPKIWTDEKKKEAQQEILSLLAKGNSLLTICKAEHLPNRDTVNEWKREDLHGFAVKYAQAKREQIEYRIDNIYDEINDISTKNTIKDEFGNTKIDTGAVALKRLYIDTLKWQAGKEYSEKYGDKLPEDDKNKTFNLVLNKEDLKL